MFTKTLIAVSLAASALISTSAFAHEKVDLLIKNATVLTMDKDRTVFEQGLVAVKGKLADIIVIDTKAPNMAPLYNPYSALVYSAYAANVKHTIVDGNMLMEDRNMLTVDETAIREEALAFADKVRKTVIESGEIIQ